MRKPPRLPFPIKSYDVICRACLKKCDKLYPIKGISFSDSPPNSDVENIITMASVFEKYCLVKRIDKGPQNICHPCIELAYNSYDFFEMFKQSQILLDKIMQKHSKCSGRSHGSKDLQGDITDLDSTTFTEEIRKKKSLDLKTQTIEPDGNNSNDESQEIIKVIFEGTDDQYKNEDSHAVHQKVTILSQEKCHNNPSANGTHLKLTACIKQVRKPAKNEIQKNRGIGNIDKESDYNQGNKQKKTDNPSIVHSLLESNKMENIDLQTIDLTRNEEQESDGFSYKTSNNCDMNTPATNDSTRQHVSSILSNLTTVQGLHKPETNNLEGRITKQFRVKRPHLRIVSIIPPGKRNENNAAHLISKYRYNISLPISNGHTTEKVFHDHNYYDNSIVRTIEMSKKDDRIKLIREKMKTSYKKPPVKCNLCDDIFPSKKSLRMHMWKHGKKYIYNCKYCIKTFNNQADYKKHLNADHEKRYMCSVCGKAFAVRNSFYFHLSYHKFGKRRVITKGLSCTICDKKFKRSNNLTDHMNVVHLGAAGYKCDVCGSMFSSNKSLMTHTKLESHQGPYKCAYCQISFTTKVTRSRHIKYQHPKCKPCVKEKSQKT